MIKGRSCTNERKRRQVTNKSYQEETEKIPAIHKRKTNNPGQRQLSS